MSAALPANAIQRRMIGFVAHLRRNEFQVGPGETLAALELLRRQGVQDLVTTRRSLRVLLASCQDEWERFDDLFEAYWFARGRVRQRLREPEDSQWTAALPGIWQEHLGERARRAPKFRPPETGPCSGAGNRVMRLRRDRSPAASSAPTSAPA